jgi:hypothetical protein
MVQDWVVRDSKVSAHEVDENVALGHAAEMQVARVPAWLVFDEFTTSSSPTDRLCSIPSGKALCTNSGPKGTRKKTTSTRAFGTNMGERVKELHKPEGERRARKGRGRARSKAATISDI